MPAAIRAFFRPIGVANTGFFRPIACGNTGSGSGYVLTCVARIRLCGFAISPFGLNTLRIEPPAGRLYFNAIIVQHEQYLIAQFDEFAEFLRFGDGGFEQVLHAERARIGRRTNRGVERRIAYVPPR